MPANAGTAAISGSAPASVPTLLVPRTPRSRRSQAATMAPPTMRAVEDEPPDRPRPGRRIVVPGGAGRRGRPGQGGHDQQADRHDGNERRRGGRGPEAAHRDGEHGEEDRRGQGRERDHGSLEEHRPDDLAEGRAATADEGDRRSPAPRAIVATRARAANATAAGPIATTVRMADADAQRAEWATSSRQQPAPHRDAIRRTLAARRLGLGIRRLEPAQVHDQRLPGGWPRHAPGRCSGARCSGPARPRPRLAWVRQVVGLAPGGSRRGRGTAIAAERPDRDLRSAPGRRTRTGLPASTASSVAGDPHRHDAGRPAGQRVARVDRQEQRVARRRARLGAGPRPRPRSGPDDLRCGSVDGGSWVGPSEGAKLVGQVHESRRRPGRDARSTNRIRSAAPGWIRNRIGVGSWVPVWTTVTGRCRRPSRRSRTRARTGRASADRAGRPRPRLRERIGRVGRAGPAPRQGDVPTEGVRRGDRPRAGRRRRPGR